MIRTFRVILPCFLTLTACAQDDLRTQLENTYGWWRTSITRKDVSTWQRVTAPHRIAEIRNRMLSEKRAYPASVFALPAPPPSLDGLQFLEANAKGPTAKASYFGKVDFGVGGAPTENLLVLSFVRGKSHWLYDRADFVNLSSLPQVRKELAAGDLKYLRETPEARPSGTVPRTPVEVGPAKYIAKVYVFCPGREVRMQVNKISHHRFANTKESEVVIGGANDGINEVTYTVRKLDGEGATGREAMTVRVYLMSEVPDVQPLKVFEYQVNEGDAVKTFGTGTFNVDAAILTKLSGK
ncbi:MAG: hypothetical protein V4733_04245 [Verrucomicrobiota bacterium]